MVAGTDFSFRWLAVVVCVDEFFAQRQKNSASTQEADGFGSVDPAAAVLVTHQSTWSVELPAGRYEVEVTAGDNLALASAFVAR